MAIKSGKCGTNLTYVLNDDYSLVISGTGAMTDYGTSSTNCAPWYNYRFQIISVTLPSGLTTIGDCAFYSCTRPTSVTIPDSVTTIGSYAFYNCSRLTSVTIPDSVTTIKNNAFSGCLNLTSVTIPDSVTTIETRVFYNCSGLTSITIPSSVTTIGSRAFNGCTSLTSITFLKSSSTGISFGSLSFALGTSSNPVTATVYSPDNWASSILDGYKNSYTTFIYSLPSTPMDFNIYSNDGQTLIGSYTYNSDETTAVTAVASPSSVHLTRGQDVQTIPVTAPTGKVFFGLTSTTGSTTTDISDTSSGSSTTVSTGGAHTYYAVFGSVINYFKYNDAPILVDRGICDEDGNDIAETYAKKADVPNITVSSSAPISPVEGDIWIQY